MAHKTKFLAAAAVAALPNTVFAEGLERNNLDANFLFTEGSAAELSIGNVSPTLPATLPAALGGSKIDNVAGGFQIMTTSAKTSIGDNLDLGLWYTNQGNGVDIDWGATVGIKAQVSLSTLVGLARYKLNENYSLIGGIKQVNVASGGEVNLRVPAGHPSLPENTPLVYNMGSASATGTVVGVAYERPEVAARVVLTSESAIDMKIPTTLTAGGAAAGSGDSVGGIGDAINLSFQTGIAPDTLLFGNFRSSNWADNQLTLFGSTTPVSTFEDGNSWSLGVARKLSDSLAVSASYFSDPGDGNGVSELAPTGETRSVSLGARYSLSDAATLSLGATMSQKGDATTSSLGAKTSDIRVNIIGAKISIKF